MGEVIEILNRFLDYGLIFSLIWTFGPECLQKVKEWIENGKD